MNQTARLTALALAALCGPAAAQAPAAGGDPAPLVFSAMGCGPYDAKDAAAARFYIARENQAPNSQFLVHLGDICKGSAGRDGTLTEKTYSDVKDLFTKGNAIPAYIVPGDNEWNDRPDPDVGWSLWSKHLLGLERNFRTKWKTERQKERPENFAFVADGVLVIGINLPGGRVHDNAEWARRFREDNDWIEANFAAYKGKAKAAVVCAQANVIGQGKIKGAVNLLFSTFTVRFGKLAADFGKPVLFLHADGHVWTVDKPWKAAPNVTRIQLDRLEPKFPPVQFTVDPSAPEPFRFDRRLGEAKWKAPAK